MTGWTLPDGRKVDRLTLTGGGLTAQVLTLGATVQDLRMDGVGFPLVLGCQEPIAEWKIPNMRGIMTARTKPLKVVEPVANDQLTAVNHYELPAPRGAVKMIPADEAEKLIQLLHTEAKVI